MCAGVCGFVGATVPGLLVLDALFRIGGYASSDLASIQLYAAQSKAAAVIASIVVVAVAIVVVAVVVIVKQHRSFRRNLAVSPVEWQCRVGSAGLLGKYHFLKLCRPLVVVVVVGVVVIGVVVAGFCYYFGVVAVHWV